MRIVLFGLAVALLGGLLQVNRHVGGGWINDLADVGEVITWLGWAVVTVGLFVLAVTL